MPVSPTQALTLFSRGSAQCTNGASPTIVRHELGHAFASALPLLDPNTAADYSGFQEGVADAVAALSMATPCLGRDFLGAGAGCFRDLTAPHLLYPVANNDPHLRGLPLAASFWDLYTYLGANPQAQMIVSALFLNALWVNQTGLDPRIYLDVQRADLVLFSGRHRRLIHAAFARHHLVP